MTHVRGLVCRECGRGVRAEPDPRLRALLRPPRGRLRLRRDPRDPDARPHRGGPPEHLALPRSSAARRRAPGRSPRGHDAAGARAEPRGRLGAPGALPQERRGLPPHLVLQGPRGLRGREQGQGARPRHGRVRLHGEPRQLGRGPRRRGGPARLRVHPGRARGRQGSRDARLRAGRVRRGRHLRRRQPSLLGARRSPPLGLRQREPPALLRRGIQDGGLRDRRAAGLARARSRGRPVRRRLAPDQDPEGVRRARGPRPDGRGGRRGCTRRRRPAAGPS